jgi:hypothetical protein
MLARYWYLFERRISLNTFLLLLLLGYIKSILIFLLEFLKFYLI